MLPKPCSCCYERTNGPPAPKPRMIRINQDEKSAKIVVGLMKEVCMSFNTSEPFKWMECPTIPDQVLETFQKMIIIVHGTWKLPKSESITVIRQIEEMDADINELEKSFTKK